MPDREATMGVHFFVPDDDVSDVLDGLWVQELDAGAADGVSLQVLPSPSTVICIQYRAPVRQDDNTTLYRSAVTGLQSATHTYSAQGAVGSVVARFTPWGAAAALPVPLRDVSDRHVHLQDMFPATAVTELEDRIAGAESPAQRAALLQDFIRASASRERDRVVEHATQLIRRSGGQGSVSAIAREVGLSERQLERRFVDRVGVGPKALMRIVRFQSVLALRKRGARWLDAAMESGYFDQSHLARDIKALTGLLPSDFLARPESAVAQHFASIRTGSGFSHACYL